MISKEAIDYLYKKTKRPKEGFSETFLTQISEKCSKYHKLQFNDGYMIIGALEEYNPFRKIKISAIRGIVELDVVIAVVLNTSIIFFNNHTGKIDINIRSAHQKKISFLQRLTQFFHKN